MPASDFRIQEDINLAPYNTLSISAKAKHFIKVESEDALNNVLQSFAADYRPYFVLGGGSNILFKKDFEGLIIRMGITGKEIVKEDDDFVWLKIGAGENWHQTVRYCVEKGWGGIENLSLIPGTVGAAPIQNIGAYGVELVDVFDSLTAIELETGSRQLFNKKECRFAYRDSIFKNELKGQFAVTHVTLRLTKNPKINSSYGAIKDKLEEKEIRQPTIADISNIVIAIRESKLPDPSELANAGSFFKNPIITTKVFESLQKKHPDMPGYAVDKNHTKVPAGWLIEQTGWKGKEVGNVGTYRQQALVIVNHGEATGHEILQLAKSIQQSVVETFDIELVPEVNIIG